MSRQLVFAVVVCSLLSPLAVLGQQTQTPLPGRISGMVQGEAAALVSAGVTVRSAKDSAVVGGSMTDGSGRFRIDGLAFGKYNLRISFVGYKPHNVLNITISRDTPQIDLGRMKLEVAPVALNALEVQADKAPVVVQSDRNVYNTKAMPVASTGKAIDVLRNVSELEVDMEGKVTMRGNQPVAIHFDGRPAPLRGDALKNYLQQMPGNRIARVEVIPNPSAKYDPEGMGGIVNIVMKEGMDLGLSGSLSMNASTRLQRGAYGRLNYQKGRFTLFAGSSLSWSDNRYDMYDVRQNLLAHPVTTYETSAKMKGDGLFNMFDFTSEYKAGKKATLWLSGTGYGSDFSNVGTYLFGITDENNVALERYDRDSNRSYGYGNQEYSAGFKQVFQEMRHEFTIDFRRRHNGNDGDGNDLKTFLLFDKTGELTLNDDAGDDTENSLQADYTRPLGKKGKLETGLRASLRDQDSESNYWYYATPTRQQLRWDSHVSWLYEEDLASAYATASRTVGKWNVQAGLRGERANTTFHVRSTNSDYDNDYFSLFPSGNLAYDFGKGRTVRASYSKRVARPYPYLLNPYNPSADTLSRFSGNPYLKPNYTHSVSLDYNMIGKLVTLRAGPFWRRTYNNWDAIRLVDEKGISTVTYKNIASLESYGGSFTASLRPTPTAKLGGSATWTIFRELRDASNVNGIYSTDAVKWSLNGNLMYKLDKTLTASAFGSYRPPQTMMQGRMSGMTFTNVGLRKQFLGTKASANMYVSDPLNLYHYKFTTTDVTHVQRSSTSMKMRQASFSVTYNFGKPPQQNSRKQQTESQQTETVQIR